MADRVTRAPKRMSRKTFATAMALGRQAALVRAGMIAANEARVIQRNAARVVNAREGVPSYAERVLVRHDALRDARKGIMGVMAAVLVCLAWVLLR